MTDRTIPSAPDFADAEHCVLEDATVEHPKLYPEFVGSKEPHEVRDEVTIEDRLRGRVTSVKIYAEGWIDLETARRGRSASQSRFNLRYLDAVPMMDRFYPINLMKAAAALAALSAATSLLAFLGWQPGFTIPVAVVASALTLAAGVSAFYLSHERITFRTLHGRAKAISIDAGLGTIGQYQALVPRIVEAIADAAESVHDETAIYLRAEMREHYRLANEGVLSDEECAKSTGRILNNFGGPL